MKYIKAFEKGIKTDRAIFVGDKVVWCGQDKHDLGAFFTLPTSYNIKNGEICEITQLKTVKKSDLVLYGNYKTVIYAKAKNVETGEPINKVLDANNHRAQYSKDGHWFEFDRFFKSEFDVATSKYNL